MGPMAADLASTRLTSDPAVRSGQPIVAGTRITVWDILTWLGGGLPEATILADYPELAPEDIRAALQFASKLRDRAI